MTRATQREQEVGFLAVLCGVIAGLANGAILLFAWLTGNLGFVLAVGIAVLVWVLVTLVVGTVLLRALKKGDQHDKAREEYWRGRQHRKTASQVGDEWRAQRKRQMN